MGERWGLRQHFETIMDPQEYRLNPKQRRILPLLLTNNLTDACRLSGISRKAVWEWRKEEGFQNALEAARRAAFTDGLDLVKGNIQAAIKTLADLMETAERDADKIRCAQTILEHGVALKRAEDLEKRIADLEQALGPAR